MQIFQNVDFNDIILKLQIPEAPTKWQRFKKFVKDVAVSAKNKIVDFFKGMYHNAESISVLVLSSFGLSALIGELPFWMTLPWWVEAPLVIPVLSVGIIYLLVYNGERRMLNRANA